MAASIKRNTLYNLIKTASAVAFPLITFPYSSRVLHAENIGKINFSSSIISYIQLIASLGISTYAIRECSKVKNDNEALSSTASQMLSINIFFTIFAYLVLSALLLAWRPLDSYRTLILIQSLSILFTTLGTEWLNISMEDFKYITMRTFLFQILSIVCMFLFVHKPEHYVVYAVIGVFSSSGANIANIIYRRRYCRTYFTFKIDWKRHLKPIFILFALYVSQIIYVNVDITMLGIMKDDFEVGLYATATRIYNIANMAVASVAYVTFSELSFLYNQQQRDYVKINRLLKYAIQFIITLGFPCIVMLNLLASEIIEIIAGKEFLGAVPALHILTVSLFFSYFGGYVGSMILTPQGKDKVNLKICMISAALNFILNIIFIPKWGLYAAAATTAISEIVCFCLAARHIEKKVNLGSLLNLAGSQLLACIFMACVAVFLKIIISGLILKTVLILISSALAYFAVLYIFRNELVVSFINSAKNKLIRKS